jgi:hypothetical protein
MLDGAHTLEQTVPGSVHVLPSSSPVTNMPPLVEEVDAKDKNALNRRGRCNYKLNIAIKWSNECPV